MLKFEKGKIYKELKLKKNTLRKFLAFYINSTNLLKYSRLRIFLIGWT